MYIHVHVECTYIVHTVHTTVGVPGGNSPAHSPNPSPEDQIEFQGEVIEIIPVKVTNLRGEGREGKDEREGEEEWKRREVGMQHRVREAHISTLVLTSLIKSSKDHYCDNTNY